MASTAAVFFDVDFTLIHPGPRFQGAGYQASCVRHGVAIAPGLFETAVRRAADALESADQLYDAELFINYTRRIVEGMGGRGAGVDAVARELYDDWAEHHHFSLYDDVPQTLRQLTSRGLQLGLISNSHRCLASFQEHFELDGLISATVSSSTHGFMKPHPSIFRAALDLAQVPAERAAMVGDSLAHDVAGARAVGMRAILLARGDADAELDRPVADGVAVIRSLAELPDLLAPGDPTTSEAPSLS